MGQQFSAVHTPVHRLLIIWSSLQTPSSQMWNSNKGELVKAYSGSQHRWVSRVWGLCLKETHNLGPGGTILAVGLSMLVFLLFSVDFLLFFSGTWWAQVHSAANGAHFLKSHSLKTSLIGFVSRPMESWNIQFIDVTFIHSASCTRINMWDRTW